MHAAAIRWFDHRPRAATPPVVAFDPADFSPALKTRLLILQPTPFCNIDCDYCYLPNRLSTRRMRLETVRLAAERLREDGLLGDRLDVLWHAGEPTTVPAAFYDEAADLIERVIGPACRIGHAMQTNATLIDDAWCELFLRRGMRVGVSVDGPAALHDLHRRTRGGKGTHAATLRGIARLRAHGIETSAIAVVTEAALGQADAFADFFLEQGIGDVGCNIDEAEGIHPVSSLMGRGQAHARFMHRLQQRAAESEGRLRIREFAHAERLIDHGLPRWHWRGEACPDNDQVLPFAMVTVAANGDFGTGSPELLGQSSAQYGDFVLGNVAAQGYFEAARGEPFARLWQDVMRGVAACRSACAHFNFCGGGAPANKLYENGSFASGETLYCRAMLKQPFDLTLLARERALESHGVSP